MCDELDLTHAELFADSNRGQYIPQFFAQAIDRDCVTSVTAEDWKTLEAGPDHDLYWDAWASVLDSATITDKDGKKYSLHQDGDLWLVPIVPDQEATPEPEKPQFDLYEFTICTAYLPYFINGDLDSYTEDELTMLAKFEAAETKGLKNWHYGYSEPSGQFATCEICKLRADTCDLQIIYQTN